MNNSAEWLRIPLLIYSCAFVAFTNICTIASHKFGNYVNIIIGIVYLNETFFVIIFVSNFFSFTFWNLSSAEVSLRKSVSDFDEDFVSKEDFLLYLVAIQQKKNRFQKTIFHTKSLTMIILAFRIKNSGIFIF